MPICFLNLPAEPTAVHRAYYHACELHRFTRSLPLFNSVSAYRYYKNIYRFFTRFVILIKSHFGIHCSKKILLGLKWACNLNQGQTNTFLRLMIDKISSICFIQSILTSPKKYRKLDLHFTIFGGQNCMICDKPLNIGVCFHIEQEHILLLVLASLFCKF